MTVDWKNPWIYLAAIGVLLLVIVTAVVTARCCSTPPSVEIAKALQEDAKASADAIKESSDILSSAVIDIAKEQKRLNDDLTLTQKYLDVEIKELKEQLDASLSSIQGLMDATLDTQIDILRRQYEDFIDDPERVGPAFDDLFGVQPGDYAARLLSMDLGEGVLVREAGEAGPGDVPSSDMRTESIPD